MTTNSTTNDGFQVGDVVFSILPIDQFITLHKGTWKYLNGEGYENTDLALHLDFENEKLPDARGVFIRGMNRMDQSRSKVEGDIDSERLIGSYQKDGIKKHNHKLPIAQEQYGTYGEYSDHGNPGQPFKSYRETTIQEDGIDETRPRNITLYIYIKLSN